MGKARVRDVLTGEPFQVAYKNVIASPSVVQTLVDYTVIPGQLLRVYQVRVVCRITGSYVVKKDGVIVGSGRTGPGESKDSFDFLPYLKAQTGNNLKVEFTSRSGIPANIVDIECYLQAGQLVF